MSRNSQSATQKTSMASTAGSSDGIVDSPSSVVSAFDESPSAAVGSCERCHGVVAAPQCKVDESKHT